MHRRAPRYTPAAGGCGGCQGGMNSPLKFSQRNYWISDHPLLTTFYILDIIMVEGRGTNRYLIVSYSSLIAFIDIILKVILLESIRTYKIP